MLLETAIRKDINDEIVLEIDTLTTQDKKGKRKAYELLERLDILGYHYFSQEYEALKSCYIYNLLYIRYRKHRYLAGAISWHVSGMNKTLRNIFFGSEFFGHFRKFMLDKYQVPAKFLTISRFVLFPQFRGTGLASRFVDLATREVEKQSDVMMLEIFSSMLYNFDFMPDDWIKYSNIVQKSFSGFDTYSEFCKTSGIVRTLEDARKVLTRAIKHADEGGRVRAADLPCSQVQSQAARMLSATGTDNDLLDTLDSKKRNQSFRQSKQMYRRVPRSDKVIQRKSGSMFNRMDEAESFVNIASFMFYISKDKFKYFNEYFSIDDMINYESLLISYKDFGDLYKSKVAGYKRHRKKQLPIFVDLFSDFCNKETYIKRITELQAATSQKLLMKKKAEREI